MNSLNKTEWIQLNMEAIPKLEKLNNYFSSKRWNDWNYFWTDNTELFNR